MAGGWPIDWITQRFELKEFHGAIVGNLGHFSG
jgi:hypothetical protein